MQSLDLQGAVVWTYGNIHPVAHVKILYFNVNIPIKLIESHTTRTNVSSSPFHVGRQGCLHCRVPRTKHNSLHPSLRRATISPLYNMETAVLRKAVLSDSKALPRKFCGHPSSGRGGRDVSQRMEPQLPVSSGASYPSQDVRSQRSFWEVMCRLGLRECEFDQQRQ